jgi:hypothetical protein
VSDNDISKVDIASNDKISEYKMLFERKNKKITSRTNPIALANVVPSKTLLKCLIKVRF